jgi:hypothetical protein
MVIWRDGPRSPHRFVMSIKAMLVAKSLGPLSPGSMKPIQSVQLFPNLAPRSHPAVFERHQRHPHTQVAGLLPCAEKVRNTLPLRFSYIRCGGCNLLQRLKDRFVCLRVYHAPPPVVGGANAASTKLARFRCTENAEMHATPRTGRVLQCDVARLQLFNLRRRRKRERDDGSRHIVRASLEGAET